MTNEDKKTILNICKRMYNNTKPFEKAEKISYTDKFAIVQTLEDIESILYLCTGMLLDKQENGRVL